METISIERAFEIVMNTEFTTGKEYIQLTSSLDRVLAEDVTSDVDMPPFHKSTVDGFACRKDDLGKELTIIETIPAGKWPAQTITEGTCSKIMTGAPVPEGADCIVMVEETQIISADKIRFTGSYTKDNIAFRGEDVKTGDAMLKSGKFIKPQHIAVMASAGHTLVCVSKKPDIAVISSGNELVEPEVKPGISEIRNSNASQLMAQIARAGSAGHYYGIAPDDEKASFGMVQNAMITNDIVLITGGVSMGDFDFIPEVLEKAGVRLLFTSVAVQPGKPTTFGVHSGGVVFGLPGNPVSSFIQFEILVRPLICKMMGYDWKPNIVFLQMEERYTRKNTGRAALIPVSVTGQNTVKPVEYHGSAHISALSGADGIIAMPVGKAIFEKGEIVGVRQI